jgi:hypothetical protein
MKASSKKRVKLEFKGFETPFGTVYIAYANVNPLKSMRILDSNDLEPPPCHIILSAIDRNEGLKEALKNRGFYVANTGFDFGDENTFNEKSVIKLKDGESVPFEKSVGGLKGSRGIQHSPILAVNSRGHGGTEMHRYCIYTDGIGIASAIVGIKKNSLPK